MGQIKKKVFWYLVTKTVGEIIGSTAKGVVKVYKKHFELIYEAIKESKKGNRDQEILEKIRKSIEKMTEKGKILNSKIPRDPQKIFDTTFYITVNSIRNSNEFDEKIRKFTDECIQITIYLEDYIQSSEEIVSNHPKSIAEIKKNIESYSKTYVGIRNKFTSEYLVAEQETTEVNGISDLEKQKSDAEKKLKNYDKLLRKMGVKQIRLFG